MNTFAMRNVSDGREPSLSSRGMGGWVQYNETWILNDGIPPVENLVIFHEGFLQVHGYLSIFVCIFGVITNACNITILASKDMRTATNFLLLALAVTDILTMVPYMPFAVHFYCPVTDPSESPKTYSYGWLLYMVIMIHVLATTHTISIWLAVTLAAFRFTQIRAPCPRGPLAKERRIRHVKIATAIIYVASVLVLIPNYASNEIVRVPIVGSNVTAYGMKDQQLGTPHTDLAVFTNAVIYAVLAKLLPCLLILIFSGSLLYHMGIKMNRRRQRLSATRQQARTTKMLLVVLVFFILTELPQGIMILLSANIPGFYLNVYYPLGDLTDFLALLNNAVNFLLYCTMSQQFREKFAGIYLRPLCNKRREMMTSASELLILREHVPKNNTALTTTTTTTTVVHDEHNMNI